MAVGSMRALGVRWVVVAAPLCLRGASLPSKSCACTGGGNSSSPGSSASCSQDARADRHALHVGGMAAQPGGDGANGVAPLPRDLQAAATASAGPPLRPHILLVLLDDLGYNDLGRFTAPAPHRCEMPVVSSLVEGGVRLSNFYVLPLCSPTRAALLTGRHPIHYGGQTHVSGNWVPGSRTWVPREEPMLPQRLKDAGYSTRMAGKWHLGHGDLADVPTGRGFDEFYGLYGGDGDHWTHQWTIDRSAFRNGWVWPGHPDYQALPTTPPARHPVDLHHDYWLPPEAGVRRHVHETIFTQNGTHSTDVISREAARMVYEHSAADVPLFLYVAYQAPHTPVQNPPGTEERHMHIPSLLRRKWCGLVSHVDDGVSRIVAALKARGMWESTVLLLFSDNGGDVLNGASNHPYRGRKATPWEGGTRTPAFLHAESPALVPESRRGTSSGALGHVTDIFPTILGLAGGDSSPTSTGPLSGYDMWSAWTRGAPSPRHEMVYNAEATGIMDCFAQLMFHDLHQLPQTRPPKSKTWEEFRAKMFPKDGQMPEDYYAVRVGPWKLIVGYPGNGDWEGTDPASAPSRGDVVAGDGGQERLKRGDGPFEDVMKSLWLFDLENDPLERNDLSGSMPAKVQEMRAHAARLLKDQRASVLAGAASMSQQERARERRLYDTQFRQSPSGSYLDWWEDSPERARIEAPPSRL